MRALRGAIIAALIALAGCASAPAPEPAPKEEADVPGAEIIALRLRPGQDLKVDLREQLRARGCQAAFVVTCVGSLTTASLRFAGEPEYTTLDEGPYEIVSLVGTIGARSEHLHISLSDKTGRVIGGHLGEGAKVYTTAELVIGEAPALSFERAKDPDTGYFELSIRER